MSVQPKLKRILTAAVALPLLLAGLVSAQALNAQQATSKPQVDQDLPQSSDATGTGQADSNAADPTTVSSTPATPVTPKQPKRILGIIPNNRAVSADTQLPPLSTKGKFKLATQDTFDYGSVIVAGLVAGVSQINNSIPEFGHGPAGYGRYFWRSYVDQINGNYFTEAIIPSLTHQDPRYYTLGHGSVLHRSGYAVSRLFITRTDSGGRAFNFSEIGGNGIAAGVSNLYYPESQRTWVKTRQKWTEQIAVDGILNVLKEFWPDISAHVFKKQN
jgi:hypothetical protein